MNLRLARLAAMGEEKLLIAPEAEELQATRAGWQHVVGFRAWRTGCSKELYSIYEGMVGGCPRTTFSAKRSPTIKY